MLTACGCWWHSVTWWQQVTTLGCHDMTCSGRTEVISLLLRSGVLAVEATRTWREDLRHRKYTGAFQIGFIDSFSSHCLLGLRDYTVSATRVGTHNAIAQNVVDCHLIHCDLSGSKIYIKYHQLCCLFIKLWYIQSGFRLKSIRNVWLKVTSKQQTQWI